MEKFTVRTQSRDQMVDVTAQVRAEVAKLGLTSGAAVVFVPHTTAGVTINENADPDVVHDVLNQLDAMSWRQPFYRHNEENSASHVKATMTGSSVTVPVEGGRLQLGTWQAIYLCEFDGPRTGEVWVQGLKAGS